VTKDKKASNYKPDKILSEQIDAYLSAYQKDSLRKHLNDNKISIPTEKKKIFVLSIQWEETAKLDNQGFCGRILSGSVK